MFIRRVDNTICFHLGLPKNSQESGGIVRLELYTINTISLLAILECTNESPFYNSLPQLSVQLSFLQSLHTGDQVILVVMLQKSTKRIQDVIFTKMMTLVISTAKHADLVNQSGLYLAPSKREQPEQATCFILIYSLYLHLVSMQMPNPMPANMTEKLIDSKGNPADALTKALPKVDFERLRKLLVSKKEKTG